MKSLFSILFVCAGIFATSKLSATSITVYYECSEYAGVPYDYVEVDIPDGHDVDVTVRVSGDCF